MATNNNQGLGAIGQWVDVWTGLGYSGAKKKATDIPAQTQVGQQQNLNRNPEQQIQTSAPQIPIVPPKQTTTQTSQNQTMDMTQFDSNDPLRKFNLALMDMLKKAQSGETKTSQEQAQLRREAYQSGQEVFEGEEAKMTPEAKMATLNRNVESFNPSIQAATTKINQLRDIMNLMTTTYGEDFSKMLPVTEEDAQTFKLALQAGMNLPVDILEKYKKFFTTDDFAAWSKANQPKVSAPSSVQEYQYYKQQEEAAGRIPKSYGEFATTQKAPTANQEVTALYANRLEQAESVFDQLEDYTNGLSAFELKTQELLPNPLRSANYQSLDQAQRNFVNATLRRESGAAIAPSEFDSATKQYFIRPGDSAQVIAQKKLNRQQVIAGFISGSGNAYIPSQYLGGDTSQLKVRRLSDGIIGRIPANEFDDNLYEIIQ